MNLSNYDKMPCVAALMTPFPYFVHPDDAISRVVDLMDEHGIHHVPVKEAGEVVGVVSDRDLRWMRNPALAPGNPNRVSVRDVQAHDPYTVELSASLDSVLHEMAARRIDVAIVVKAGKLAGIVTFTDVCDALGDLLEGRFGTSDPGDAA